MLTSGYQGMFEESPVAVALSRPHEKFLIEPIRKFLSELEKLGGGTNRDEPKGTRPAAQAQAAERMKVSERWVRKLLQRKKREGDRVVVYGLRGGRSNRRLPERLRK